LELDIRSDPEIIPSPANGNGVDDIPVRAEPSPTNDPENDPDNPGVISGVP
jgi:hypothetical protein